MHVLTDLLDYEFEVLSQFMNLGMSFLYRATELIQLHKIKLKALSQLVLRVGESRDLTNLTHIHIPLIF
jgi:hypothetical protein